MQRICRCETRSSQTERSERMKEHAEVRSCEEVTACRRIFSVSAIPTPGAIYRG